MISYKKVAVLTVLTLILLSGAVFAQQFDDVPRDHWAYDSVQTLAKRGLLDLYSGENFNGEEALTRYEMAEIITDVLNNIGGKSSEQLSSEDVDVIRDLSLEFRDELVSVAERQKNFEDRLKTLEDNNQIQNEDISNINVKIAEIQENSNVKESITEIDERIESLEAELKTLEQEGVSNQRLNKVETKQESQLDRIEELENRIEELEGKKSEVESESSSGGINTGYILGGLLLLAVML